jgi:hypothetical protein
VRVCLCTCGCVWMFMHVWVCVYVYVCGRMHVCVSCKHICMPLMFIYTTIYHYFTLFIALYDTTYTPQYHTHTHTERWCAPTWFLIHVHLCEQRIAEDISDLCVCVSECVVSMRHRWDMHTHSLARSYAHAITHTHTHTYILTYLHAHAITHMHPTWTLAHMPKHSHVYTHTDTHSLTCPRNHTHTHTWIHTHTHILKYTQHVCEHIMFVYQRKAVNPRRLSCEARHTLF